MLEQLPVIHNAILTMLLNPVFYNIQGMSSPVVSTTLDWLQNHINT